MPYMLCYPTLSEKDHEFIRFFRREHDLPFRDVVEHHFTVMFGISDVSRADYVNHVRAKLLGQRKIEFICGCAALGDDSESDDFYVFLTPDEGLSDICRVQDKLYSHTGFLFNFDLLYERMPEGHYEAGMLERQMPSILVLLGQPGVRDWWSRNKQIFGLAFVEFVERAWVDTANDKPPTA